jgi:two-component system sensor histidine kinase AgrC
LNNLLILKNFSNRNSKEYNDLLDEMIDSNNKKVGIKNIYNLPSGLKGIFYYKLYNLDNSEYNISINISKKVGNLLNNISRKDYINLYKIINIILDNALEACEKTKNKYLLIDIYKEDGFICFDISNSCKGTINLDEINKKGFSTKGKNRGLGLSIVKNILKANDSIEMKQFVKDNIFTTIIKVSI